MRYLDNMRASKAIGAKKYDVAIEIYKRMYEEDKNDPYALSMLAICYEWNDQKDLAFNYANQRVSQDPNDFQMLLVTARYWAANNNSKETYNIVCRILENAPSVETANMPKLFIAVLRLLSKFKKYQGIESRAIEDTEEYNKDIRESIAWAKKYKEWFESTNISFGQIIKNT